MYSFLVFLYDFSHVCALHLFVLQVAKKASVLRRRKSRARMGQLGSPTGENGNGDFEDNVFEVDEGGNGGTGRTGRADRNL